MQKKLIALAVAGLVSGGAFAQSNVTLYGSFDAGVRNVDTVNAAGDSNLTMGSFGTYNSNRWGLRGSEDMGGGLKARFNLEGDFNTGTGANTLLFGRSAWVGLEGGFGTLDLGRQYTVIFKTIGAYDPFNYKYTGIIPTAGMDAARRNNDIQWAKSFGGVTLRAQYALGEVPGDTGKGSTGEIGASWANGPLSVGGAYGAGQGATGLDATNWTLGGAYNAGSFRVAGGYDEKELDAAVGASTVTKNGWIGVSFKMGAPHELTLAYYDTQVDAPTAAASAGKQLVILGYTYAFSKRTNFYADIDNASLDGAARIGTNDNVTGISVGINHVF